MRMLSLAIALIMAALAPQAVLAQHKAGFDCARAATDLEKAICADPETAEGDHAMSVSYKALLAQTNDPRMAEALQADQRSFLEIRAQAWQIKGNRTMAKERLRDETNARAEFLSWINPEPPAGMIGYWRNAWGFLEITQGPDGILHVTAEAVDQVAGSWRCGYEGSLMETCPDQVTGHTLGADLVIRRVGPFLDLPENFCDETGPPMRGAIKGQFFKIGADE